MTDSVYTEKQQLVNFYPELACILNTDKKIVHANKQFLDHFQTEQIELVVFQDVRDIFSVHFEHAVQQKQLERFITHFYRENDVIQPFEVSLVPFETEKSETFIQCLIKKVEENNEKMATWTLNLEKNEATFSEELCRMLHVSPIYLNNNFDTYTKFIDERDYPFVAETIARSRRGVPYQREYRIVRFDKSTRVFKDHGRIAFNKQGLPERLTIETTDVTPTEDVASQIEQALAGGKLRKALDQAAVVLIADLKGTIREVNQRFCEVSKYSRNELIGKKVNVINSNYHSRTFFKDLWETIKCGNVWRGEVRNKSKIGKFFWLRQTIIPLLDDEDKPVRFISISFDVTEEKDAEDMMKHISHVDPITRLPNDKKFSEDLQLQIELASETQGELALFLIRIFQFNKMIGTFGYKDAEQLLIQVSDVLKSFAAEHVYRIEDNKFAILIPGVTKKMAEQLMNRVVERFKEPFQLNNVEIYLTINIGASYYQKNSELSLQQEANVALTDSINHGKNHVSFYRRSMDTVHIHTYRSFMLGNDLHAALKHEQMFVQYQPQVDVFSGRIVGAEALLRWNHPEWGEISPTEFIPIAEKKDLIYQIGLFTIETVAKQVKNWQKAKLPEICCFINLSNEQLKHPQFFADVTKIIESEELEAKSLGFEIKDLEVLLEDATVEKNLKQLKESGFSITIDHLGVAFALFNGLDYIDSVKIKQEFLNQFKDDQYGPEQIHILRSLIALCHDLKKKVIAVGIETSAQRNVLRNCKCDIVQGYLYSMPLDESLFRSHLRQGTIKASTGADDDLFENRREYFRIQLHYPIKAEMTISSIKGSAVQLKSTVSLIEDIGPGGMRFVTTLNLPVNDQIILLFQFTLLGKTLKLLGHTRWKKEVRQGIYEYGFMFLISEDERESLIDLLNKVTIQLKRQRSIPDTQVVTENKFRFLLSFVTE